MKKTLTTFIIGAILFFPSTISAQIDQNLNAVPGGDSGPITDPLTKSDLDRFNPLVQHSNAAGELSTPGGIISRFLRDYAFPLAGLILFVMLIWGGFEMLSGAATQDSIKAGKQRISAALIGFLILFAVYWIARILELMFGVVILGS